MRRLTASVGCSPMAPYRYVADKEALNASIRAQAFRRLADTLDEVSSAGRDEAADVGEAYVRFARANPGAYKLMFDLDQPDERAYPELAAAAARGRKIMASYVEQLVDDGKVTGAPVMLGYALWAGLHRLITVDLEGHLPKDPGFEAMRRCLDIG